MEGIIVDNYIDKKACNLLVIKPDGSRELYEPSGNDFVKIQDFPAPATADHTHTGYTGEIRHGNNVMVFENGLLVEYR